ncbi:MAG: type II secretion system protein [Phycisphaerales bacterium]|nr:type II secretion system protein [Phycisphaerales bacterium]
MHRRAFTIIELLVVMLIITLIIAIVVPALGGARNAAKKTATRQLLEEMKQATFRFQQDHADRQPGAFPYEDMGSTENQTMGFTTLENAMIDLFGTQLASAPGDRTDRCRYWQIGPRRNLNDINGGPSGNWIDLNLLTSSIDGTEAYVSIDAKFLAPQVDEAQRAATICDLPRSGTQKANVGNQMFPDVVDAFGNPIVLWQPNPVADANDPFVLESSDDGVAQYYLNSNAGFLRTARLGRKGENQVADSLIGGDENVNDRIETIAGLLGNPNFPANAEASVEDIRPAASRGEFVFTSPGIDGLYLAKKDKGAKLLQGNPFRYGYYFKKPGSGGEWQDDSGNPTQEDILGAFDDIVVGGGN